MGKVYKHYNDYTEQNVLDALGKAPITGALEFYWKDEGRPDTVDPETIEVLIERGTAEDIYEENQFVNIMNDLLNSLTRRERKILRLRFGIGMSHDYTLEEIAKMMGLTRERVRQLEAKALRKMRHPSRTRILNGNPVTLWDIATQLPPERDEDWSYYQEQWFLNKLTNWRDETTAARLKLEEALKKLKEKGI